VDRMDMRMVAAFMYINEKIGEDMDDRMSKRM
jgi:hypothetical protein